MPNLNPINTESFYSYPIEYVAFLPQETFVKRFFIFLSNLGCLLEFLKLALP
jgi:hypothetical protein